MDQFDKSLVWFRRDLRSYDHAALYHALKRSRAVYCVFVFDTEILDPLPRKDRRVAFIHASVSELAQELQELGSGLLVVHGRASALIPQLAHRLGVGAVFANHDYEPQAIARDDKVATALKAERRSFITFKDHVIFERDEIVTGGGTPFSVFTPYKNAWLRKMNAEDGNRYLKSYPLEPYRSRLATPGTDLAAAVPTLSQLGFERTDMESAGIVPGMRGGKMQVGDFLQRLEDYRSLRDFPAADGTSRLSVHLRFGTVSIRALARYAVEASHAAISEAGASTWLSELVWRDFYCMILYHHPYVVERAFRPEYDAITWESGTRARERFHAWCAGVTGYPLVDAAMAQINQTGYMHNRLRMVTASFLIKDLGIDWRWGERYFAEKLNDFDLAANNGGWQWAASSGCDAQPYFRIFNPVTQSEKFDPEGCFIRRFVPLLSKVENKLIHAPWLARATLEKAGVRLGIDYPEPIVEHDTARKETLARYAVVKSPRRDVARPRQRR